MKLKLITFSAISALSLVGFAIAQTRPARILSSNVVAEVAASVTVCLKR